MTDTECVVPNVTINTIVGRLLRALMMELKTIQKSKYISFENLWVEYYWMSLSSLRHNFFFFFVFFAPSENPMVAQDMI